jgi:hypothetical protein
VAKKSKPAALARESELEVKPASTNSSGMVKTNKRKDQRRGVATLSPEAATYTTLVGGDGCRGPLLMLLIFSTLEFITI